MNAGDEQYPICAVCERTILRGEQAARYVDSDGDTVLVCPLCKEAAELYGWVPEHLAATRTVAGPERRSGRVRFAKRIRSAGEQAARRLQRSRSRQSEPSPVVGIGEFEVGPRTPERVSRLALEFFNATDQPRKVAGLMRSLGPPEVSVEPISAPKLARITVAWELSWYRWEVLPSGQVRQFARGDEIADLPEQARAWNASAADDGRLRLNAAQ